MGFVGRSTSIQNLTLANESDVLREASKLALERRTTVNQLVRDYLTSLVKELDRRRTAKRRLKATLKKGLAEVGPITWSRDELHQR